MAVGIFAVFLGIRVSGVGWVYYVLFALQANSILAIAHLQKPNKVCSKALFCQKSLHSCRVWQTSDLDGIVHYD